MTILSECARGRDERVRMSAIEKDERRKDSEIGRKMGEISLKFRWNNLPRFGIEEAAKNVCQIKIAHKLYAYLSQEFSNC